MGNWENRKSCLFFTMRFNCESATLEPLICFKCEFSTKIFIEFKQHLRLNCQKTIEARTYKCGKCRFETNFVIFWKWHLREDCLKDAEEFPAVECNAQPQTECTLQQVYANSCQQQNDYCYVEYFQQQEHRMMEEAKKEYWYFCNECPYKSNKSNNLKRHILYRHTDKEKIQFVECVQCKKQFKHLDNLKYHNEIVHNARKVPGERKFACEMCPYRSKTAGRLKEHIYNLHTKDEDVVWFKCQFCPYKTKKKINLKRHNSAIHHLKELPCDAESSC